MNTVTGEIAQKIVYDSWGKVLSDSNPGFQPFGFAGGLYDSVSGILRFGKRDYDPTIGRWLNKDPIRFGGGWNFYAYAGNDPVNNIDPTGLFTSFIGGCFSNAVGNGTTTGVGVAHDTETDNYYRYKTYGEEDGIDVGASFGAGIFTGNIDSFSGFSKHISVGAADISATVFWNDGGWGAYVGSSAGSPISAASGSSNTSVIPMGK